MPHLPVYQLRVGDVIEFTYRITREDLLKYGDHSLSHMIVDRIFDAAPRPFHPQNPNRDYLSYEDFIYFMLSEEDKRAASDQVCMNKRLLRHKYRIRTPEN